MITLDKTKAKQFLETKMLAVSTRRAKKFFENKMEFTTGPVELREMMDRNKEFTLVDVRAIEDFRAGHIPGAISLPRLSWSTHVGLNKEKPNIIYCYSEACHLAASAALKFSELGFPVIELEGGFEGWQHHNFTIET